LPKKYKTKLHQKVALKKLQSAVDRILYWNKNYAKYFCVKDVFLFGSLARNEIQVGDIDICVRFEQIKNSNSMEHKNEYIKWRKKELGFAPPRDFSSTLGMFELDVRKYVKNRDGRIELILWDQLGGISLTMKPIVEIVHNGKLVHETLLDAIALAKPITIEQAEAIIAKNIPEPPWEKKGVIWESYCNALNNYPANVMDKILERDNNAQYYEEFMNT
jgi:predicted nucleotidyltransferase